MHDRFPPGSFARQDESSDSDFYSEPRLVTHIDDGAIAAVGWAYRNLLPPDGKYLDLMSSWVSHFPDDMPVRRLVGLGMNELELQKNPRLDEYTVQDLNANPTLPYADQEFDGVVICVSVQYLTRPVEVLAEVGRVLKPGRPVIVSYSNRCFPTKAVRIWGALDDKEKGILVATYLGHAGCFDPPDLYDLSPKTHANADPLYVVTARRTADA